MASSIHWVSSHRCLDCNPTGAECIHFESTTINMCIFRRYMCIFRRLIKSVRPLSYIHTPQLSISISLDNIIALLSHIAINKDDGGRRKRKCQGRLNNKETTTDSIADLRSEADELHSKTSASWVAKQSSGRLL